MRQFEDKAPFPYQIVDTLVEVWKLSQSSQRIGYYLPESQVPEMPLRATAALEQTFVI